jgi:hypothetical protein
MKEMEAEPAINTYAENFSGNINFMPDISKIIT